MYWLSVLERLATPVLGNLAQRRLKKVMPIEAANPADRARYTQLEAFGRLLAGIAPWLGATGLDPAEGNRQVVFSISRMLLLMLQAISIRPTS